MNPDHNPSSVTGVASHRSWTRVIRTFSFFVNCFEGAISCPFAHVRGEGCNKWEEYLLSVSNHILAFMAILVLTFWFLLPTISHPIHPSACRPFQNWFLQIQPFLHLRRLQKLNNVHCTDIRPL